MQLLRRHHRKTFREIKAHLIAEHTARPRTSAVHAVHTVVHDVF